MICWLSLTPACQANLDYSDPVEKDSHPSTCQEESLVLLSHPKATSFLPPLGVEGRRGGEEGEGQGQMKRPISSDCPLQRWEILVLLPWTPPIKVNSSSCKHLWPLLSPRLLPSSQICCKLPEGGIMTLFLYVLHQCLHIGGSKYLLMAFVEWQVRDLGTFPGALRLPLLKSSGDFRTPSPCPSTLLEEGYSDTGTVLTLKFMRSGVRYQRIYFGCLSKMGWDRSFVIWVRGKFPNQIGKSRQLDTLG